MGLGDRVSLFDMSLDTSGTDDEASEEKEEREGKGEEEEEEEKEKEEKGKGKEKEEEEEGKFESESDGQESTKNPFHALPEPNWSAWSVLPKRIFTKPSSEKGGKLRRTID
jgi:archaellum component FlaD/FlaE